MPVIANTIPLKPYQKNRLSPPSDPQTPEPAQLYSLVVLALVLHAPVADNGVCAQCGEPWPCDQACLAYRLREGF
jgi:hypothetical protein